MKTFKISLALISVFALPLLENCDLPPDDSNHYKWIREGNVLSYDLLYAGTAREDYTKLEISRNVITNNLVIIETGTNSSAEFGAGSLDMFQNIVRRSDGLYEIVCKACTQISPCTQFASLRLPMSAVVGQALPRHVCGDFIYTYDIVVSIDSMVSSPIGDFQTIVIQDTLKDSFKFWNESKGLIRVDNYMDGTLATFLLSKTNY